MELLEKVKEFYCQVFDLKEGFRPDFSNRGYWLYADDKPIVHLSESDLHKPMAKQGYLDHVAFQASGLNEVISRLESLNHKYRMDYIPDIHLTQIFLNDPAGSRLEINFPDRAIRNGGQL